MVTAAPASVAGFTAVRLTLEYGLIVAALLLAAGVGALGGLTTELFGGDSSTIDPYFLINALDFVGFLVVLAVIFGGIAVSQALRITHTATFYGQLNGVHGVVPNTQKSMKADT